MGLFKHHCRGLWSLYGLSFKQLVEALSLRILSPSVIPLSEQLVAFGFAEQRQRINGLR